MVTGGDSDTARPSAVSTIASVHCAQRVSLLSAELELMIRVNPRIFAARRLRGETSASVRGSLDFLHGTDFIGCRRGKGGASTGTGAVRDRCHVTKLKELYRHFGATVCWQKYRP